MVIPRESMTKEPISKLRSQFQNYSWPHGLLKLVAFGFLLLPAAVVAEANRRVD